MVRAMSRLLALAALVPPVGLAGCAGLDYRPYTYTAVGDMRPRPGLFSGPDGEFVVYSKHKDPGLASGPPAPRPGGR